MPAIDLERKKPVKVTISDPETGEVLDEKVVTNDYCIVCTGDRYVKSAQMMGRTHLLAIAVRRAGE
jgi:rRNA-processing protein FCF1